MSGINERRQRLVEPHRFPLRVAGAPVASVTHQRVGEMVAAKILARLIGIACGHDAGCSQQGEAQRVIVGLI